MILIDMWDGWAVDRGVKVVKEGSVMKGIRDVGKVGERRGLVRYETV